MSSIEKLLIRGVRAFNPHEPSAIEFYTPLTLIVGHNGSGKTTIIECLKYATTGILPPNSKQGAFIHDPKIAHEPEVYAQVKLRFRNVNNKEHVITRSLQLTQKKDGNVTMKTLESLIVSKDDSGKTVSLSSKCTEMDSELAAHLGVSPAILENVIFCHQEDSLWPLSEPSILKKKFDEIFASTRYTKVLDNIKTLRKEQAKDLKVDQTKLDHLRSDMQKSEKVKQTLNSVNYAISTKQKRLDELNGGEIDQVQQQANAVMQRNATLQNLQVDLKHKAFEHEVVKKSMYEMGESLDVLSESDDELRAILQQYMQSLNERKGETSALVGEKERNEADEVRFRNEHTSKVTKYGQLKAEKEAHLRTVTQMSKMVVELSKTHHYTTFSMMQPSALSEDDKQKFITKLRQDITIHYEILEKVQNENKQKETVLNTNIQKITSEISSYEESKRIVRRQIESNRQRVAGYMDKISSNNITQSAIDDLVLKMDEQQRELDAFKTKNSLAILDGKIAAHHTDLQEKEKKMAQLHSLSKELSRQADTRAKIDVKRTEITRKSDLSAKIMSSIHSDLETLFSGKIPDLDRLEQEIDVIIRNKEKKISDFDGRLKQATADLCSIETKLAMYKSELGSKTNTLEEKKNIIKDAIGEDDYDFIMSEIDKNISQFKDLLSSLQSAESMYKRFITRCENDSSCPLCKRGFDSTEDSDIFITSLETTISKIPGQLRENKESLEKSIKRREQLLKLQSVWADVKRLDDVEMRKLNSLISDTEAGIGEKESIVDEIQTEISILKVELQAVVMLKEKAKEMTRIKSDTAILNNEIDKLSEGLHQGVGNVQTLDQVQLEYDVLQKKCQSINHEIELLNQEIRSVQKDLQVKESHLQNARDKMQESKFKFQEIQQLHKSIEECKEEMEAWQKDVEVADCKANELQPSLKEAEKELDKFLQESCERSNEASRKLHGFQTSLSQVESIQRQIQSFINNDGFGRVETCEEEIVALLKKIEETKAMIESLSGRINNAQKQASEVEVYQRKIDDNIKYRQMKRDCTKLESDVDDLKEQIRAARVEVNVNEYRLLTEKADRLVEERAGLVGELRQLQDQARGLTKDLNTDYQDITTKFEQHNMKLSMDEMASTDLEKYSKALESAIIRYHSLKMEEINKIIRELWVNTYQGSDIDTVEIRSDNENMKGNRSYNYRVVMIKGDSEIDMRGRCSAGQKVLTALIIRMALAETFGLNCGILALDEPTTNLDQANIESLAVSLMNIIKARRQQKNFQLIVITHDEDFLNNIGKSEFADHYWRIYKDESGYSKIEKHNIAKR